MPSNLRLAPKRMLDALQWLGPCECVESAGSENEKSCLSSTLSSTRRRYLSQRRHCRCHHRHDHRFHLPSHRHYHQQL